MFHLKIIGVLVANTLLSTYITFRQFRALGSSEQPAMSKKILEPGKYKEAVLYNRARCLFRIFSEFFNLAGDVFVLLRFEPFYSRFVAKLPYSETLMIFAIFLFSTVINIPLDFLFDFGIEAYYGFNKKTAETFVKDVVISLTIGSIFKCIAIHIAVYFIKSSIAYYYIYIWLCFTAMAFLLVFLFPTFIAPLYNSFVPLEDQELQGRIIALAKSVGFSASRVLVMDGSKRTSHANAYFAGLLKTKRIVLYDTILKQLAPDETLAVLSHELGHWKHGHTWILPGICSALILFYISSFNLIMKRFPALPASHSIVFFLSLCSAVSIPMILMQNSIVRMMERQADRFAIRCGYGAPLRSGLVKISTESKASHVNDPLYSMVNFSHPPLFERLELIDNELNKDK